MLYLLALGTIMGFKLYIHLGVFCFYLDTIRSNVVQSPLSFIAFQMASFIVNMQL